MEQLIFKEELSGTTIEQVIREQEFTMNTKHFHESYEVYFLIEGERYYFIDSETYLVHAGMAVLVGKNQIHKTSMAGDKSYHNRILLQLDAYEWDRYLKKWGLPPLEELFIRCEHVVECEREDFRKIAQLLSEIKAEMRVKRECFESLVRAKIAEILILIYRNRRGDVMYPVSTRKEHMTASGQSGYTGESETLRHADQCDMDTHDMDKRGTEKYIKEKHVTEKHYEARTARHQKVHEVAEYLQKYCETKESVEEIGKRFFVSKSYLSRIFKEVTGFAVNEYQTMARIRRAKELLTGTSLSITEIAEKVGFESITYFERVFKRYADKRPLQYRKEYGGEAHRYWGS